MLHYKDILATTYAEQETTLTENGADFTFRIHNPEWEAGHITVRAEGGRLTLAFATMEEDYTGEFGEMVALIDELLHDESMVFEVYSHGEDVLGGCRGTAEIDIDHSLSRFARSLCDGDRGLHTELKEIIAAGNCYCKLRGFRAARNRSLLLS